MRIKYTSYVTKIGVFHATIEGSCNSDNVHGLKTCSSLSHHREMSEEPCHTCPECRDRYRKENRYRLAQIIISKKTKSIIPRTIKYVMMSSLTGSKLKPVFVGIASTAYNGTVSISMLAEDIYRCRLNTDCNGLGARWPSGL